MNVTKKEGSTVIITKDGEVVDTLYLNEDKAYTVKGDNGAYNSFEIKDGYVNMLDASCPDQLCVKQKEIHYNNETIVCLPNKVVLQVKSSEKSDVDMIAN